MARPREPKPVAIVGQVATGVSQVIHIHHHPVPILRSNPPAPHKKDHQSQQQHKAAHRAYRYARDSASGQTWTRARVFSCIHIPFPWWDNQAEQKVLVPTLYCGPERHGTRREVSTVCLQWFVTSKYHRTIRFKTGARTLLSSWSTIPSQYCESLIYAYAPVPVESSVDAGLVGVLFAVLPFGASELVSPVLALFVVKLVLVVGSPVAELPVFVVLLAGFVPVGVIGLLVLLIFGEAVVLLRAELVIVVPASGVVVELFGLVGLLVLLIFGGVVVLLGTELAMVVPASGVVELFGVVGLLVLLIFGEAVVLLGTELAMVVPASGVVVGLFGVVGVLVLLVFGAVVELFDGVSGWLVLLSLVVTGGAIVVTLAPLSVGSTLPVTPVGVSVGELLGDAVTVFAVGWLVLGESAKKIREEGETRSALATVQHESFAKGMSSTVNYKTANTIMTSNMKEVIVSTFEQCAMLHLYTAVIGMRRFFTSHKRTKGWSAIPSPGRFFLSPTWLTGTRPRAKPTSLTNLANRRPTAAHRTKIHSWAKCFGNRNPHHWLVPDSAGDHSMR